MRHWKFKTLRCKYNVVFRHVELNWTIEQKLIRCCFFCAVPSWVSHFTKKYFTKNLDETKSRTIHQVDPIFLSGDFKMIIESCMISIFSTHVTCFVGSKSRLLKIQKMFKRRTKCKYYMSMYRSLVYTFRIIPPPTWSTSSKRTKECLSSGLHLCVSYLLQPHCLIPDK